MRVHRIIITEEAHRTIRESLPEGVYVRPGERQPDGSWATDVDDDVLAIIEAHRAPSETISDVLIRMVQTPPRPS